MRCICHELLQHPTRPCCLSSHMRRTWDSRDGACYLFGARPDNECIPFAGSISGRVVSRRACLVGK